MSKLTLDLTYDIDTSKTLSFPLTRAQLGKLDVFLGGPAQTTIKIGNYYFYYSGSKLGSNTDKKQPSKYGCDETPAQIKAKIKKLLFP
jgi:hypothetical protein